MTHMRHGRRLGGRHHLHEVHVPSGPPASHHASHHATGRHQDKRRHSHRPRCATEAPRASQRVRPSAGPPAAIFTWRSAATIRTTISKSRVRTTTRPPGPRHGWRSGIAPPPAGDAPQGRLSRRSGHQVHESASQTREATRQPPPPGYRGGGGHPDQSRQGKRYPNVIGRDNIRRYFS